MNSTNFLKGIGVGIMIGGAIGAAAAAPRKNTKKVVGRALKTLGSVVEDVTETFMH